VEAACHERHSGLVLKSQQEGKRDSREGRTSSHGGAEGGGSFDMKMAELSKDKPFAMFGLFVILCR
jgi:hypothetical protein